MASRGVNSASNDQAPEPGFVPSQDFFNPPEYRGQSLRRWWEMVDATYREGMSRLIAYERSRGNEAWADAAQAHLAGQDQAAQVASPFAPRRIDPAFIKELLRPTDRPEEPITTGVPFGPGAMALRMPGEDDARYRVRVASALMSSPGATAAVQELARRLMEGR